MALAAALLGVLLGGCGGAAPSPSVDQTPARSPGGAASSGAGPSVGAKPADTPLSAYSLSTEETVAINFAEESLVGRCMRAAGFDYVVRPFAAMLQQEQQRVAIDDARVYGITDAKIAATSGYAPPPDAATAERKPREFSDAYLVTLIGSADPNAVPKDGGVLAVGGCVGAARSQLGKSPAAGTLPSDVPGGGAAPDLGQSLSVATWQDFSASQEWSAITADWVGCMTAKGWRVTDPVFDRGDIAAVADKRAKDGAATPSPGEIELALADVSCKEKTDLVRRLREVNDRRERAVVEERAVELQESRQRLDEVVRRANVVVESSR